MPRETDISLAEVVFVGGALIVHLTWENGKSGETSVNTYPSTYTVIIRPNQDNHFGRTVKGDDDCGVESHRLHGSRFWVPDPTR